jgi:hypothetical protein
MAGQCRCGCGALLLARLQLIDAGAAEARLVLALRWCGTWCAFSWMVCAGVWCAVGPSVALVWYGFAHFSAWVVWAS